MSAERILTFVAFSWNKPFVRLLLRPWEAAFSIVYHLVLTDRRLILVRVSNPFDSSPFGGALINELFYNGRLKRFMAEVKRGDLDGALDTRLARQTFTLAEVRSLSYTKAGDQSAFAFDLRSGRRYHFRLDACFGHPITSLGGDFPYKANFSAAVEEFNRLATAAPGQ